MASNLKILYVVTHLPCPPRMGAHHRVLNIGRQLRNCGELTMVYVGQNVCSDSLAATQKEFGKVITMRPPRYKGPDLWQRLRYKFDFHWPLHYADKLSARDRETFAQLRREHDVTWFHTLCGADCFDDSHFGASVMDLDDLNCLKYALMSKLVKGLRLKAATKLLVFKWRRREMRVLDRFTLATICSGEDKRYLGGDRRIYVIPNGFARPEQQVRRNSVGKWRLGFIGELAYGPNRDGLEWFGQEIWPLIRKQVPQSRLRIVGRRPQESGFLDQPGYEHLGFMQVPADEFSTWSAMVVPLRYGGGTRLKIVDAFSKKCPVVSTSAGAHGIQASHEKDILLAEQPEAFAQACTKLLGDAGYGEQLAQKGFDLFEAKYTWDVIGQTVRQVVHDCTAQRGSSNDGENR